MKNVFRLDKLVNQTCSNPARNYDLILPTLFNWINMTANQSIIGQLGKDILDLGTKELAIFLSVTSIILILAASINKSEGFQKFVGSPTGAIYFAIKIFTICIFGTFLHGLYLHYNSLPDAVCQYTVNPIFNLVLFSVGTTLLLLGTGFSIPSYYSAFI